MMTSPLAPPLTTTLLDGQETTSDQSTLEAILDAFGGTGVRSMEDVGPSGLAMLLLLSLASAHLISYLYGAFYACRATGSQIHRAFPLLSVSITAIFICIQFSLPLSLGLLGALSIIRFRTPIKEPEEAGFLMLVIASALCCATFNMVFLAILLSVAVAGLLARRFLGPSRSDADDGLLSVVLTRADHEAHGAQLIKVLGETLPGSHLDGLVEGQQDATLTVRFRRMKPEALGGVRQAIAQLVPEARTNIYYLRSGNA
jgi:hypothetical protein